jgi:putative ABC transport system permease protein
MNLSAAGALLRLARRSVRRSLWRSSLVVILIALPVAGMVGFAALADAAQPTPDEAATNLMGRADVLLQPAEPSATNEGARLRALLPDGSRVEPVLAGADELVVDGLRVSVAVRGEDLEGLAAGRLIMREGRAPREIGEVAASPETVELTGAAIGDRILLAERGEVVVVGIAVNPERIEDRFVLSVPPAVSGDFTDVMWLVELPAGAGIDPADPNFAVDAFGTDAPYFGSSRESVRAFGETTRLSLIVVGGLALVEAALVAAAAFAVGLRRRLREFGLLAAAGAGPRHLAGAVVAEGAVLGAAGALIGIVVGVAALLAAGPWLPDITGRLGAAPRFDPGWIATAGLIGLAAALVAAGWPALTASRIPVLAALSGRRPPARPATHGLAAGIGLLVGGGGLTLAGALLRQGDGSDLSIVMLLVGAVLGVLGCGAMSPWFVERLATLAPRLPLSPRIALRDAGRSRNRSGPIVTAVLASLAATVALATLNASQEAMARERFDPEMGERHLVVSGPGAEVAGPRIAEDLDAAAAAPMRPAEMPGRWLVVETDAVVEGEPLLAWHVAVGEWELAEALEIPEAFAADLAAGRMLVLGPPDARVSRATVTVWDEDGPVETRELDARLVPAARYPALPEAILGTTAAAELGLVEPDVAQYLVRLGAAVGPRELSAAGAIAGEYPDTAIRAADPNALAAGQDTLRLVVLGISVLVALTVTGVAVALGEAEARADHRTLVTVGAHPALRRRITAARAGTVAAVGGVLAVPAGLLPVWGVLLSRGVPIVVPAPEILVAVVGLPLLAVIGGLVLSPDLPRHAERQPV